MKTKLSLALLLGAVALLTGCALDECKEVVDTAPAAPVDECGEFAKNTKDRVYFYFDNAEITPDARKILECQAAWLKANGGKCKNVTIEGHCDKRGTREYNLALGERRANAAKDALVAAGVQTNINTISYGKDKPQAEGDSEAIYAQNRTAITVVGQ